MYGSYATQPPQQQHGYQPQQPQYGYPPAASSYGGGGISGVSAGVTQQSLTMTTSLPAASVVDSEPQQQPPAPIYVDTQHDDMIHDAQLDYYGTKLATGSSGTYC